MYKEVTTAQAKTYYRNGRELYYLNEFYGTWESINTHSLFNLCVEEGEIFAVRFEFCGYPENAL